MSHRKKEDLTEYEIANFRDWVQVVRDGKGWTLEEAYTFFNESSAFFQQGVIRREWYRYPNLTEAEWSEWYSTRDAAPRVPIRRDPLKEPTKYYRRDRAYTMDEVKKMKGYSEEAMK